MNFSKKIYFNDKSLILTTDKAAYLDNNPSSGKFVIFEGALVSSFAQAIRQLETPGTTGVIVEDASREALLQQLYALYLPIDAGGGVVFNEYNEVLMIFRRGKWDLPKGKLDEGENIEDCALREVREETGLEHLVIERKICDTYHIYTQNNEQLLKRSAWYKMKGTSSDTLNPQKEENILEARWINDSELPSLAARSYEAVREVLRTAGLKW